MKLEVIFYIYIYIMKLITKISYYLLSILYYCHFFNYKRITILFILMISKKWHVDETQTTPYILYNEKQSIHGAVYILMSPIYSYAYQFTIHSVFIIILICYSFVVHGTFFSWSSAWHPFPHFVRRTFGKTTSTQTSATG